MECPPPPSQCATSHVPLTRTIHTLLLLVLLLLRSVAGAGVGKSAVIDVMQAFAESGEVELQVAEGMPSTREALASAVPLIVWDAVRVRPLLPHARARAGAD